MSTIAKSPIIDKIALRKLLWAGPLAGVVAALANLVLYFVGRAALGELYHQMGPNGPVEALPIPAVIVASFVPAIGATVLYVLLGRFTRRPTLIFSSIAAAVGLLSLASPFSLTIDLPYKLVLAAMHVVAGVAIVGVLVTQGREN